MLPRRGGMPQRANAEGRDPARDGGRAEQFYKRCAWLSPALTWAGHRNRVGKRLGITRTKHSPPHTLSPRALRHGAGGPRIPPAASRFGLLRAARWRRDARRELRMRPGACLARLIQAESRPGRIAPTHGTLAFYAWVSVRSTHHPPLRGGRSLRSHVTQRPSAERSAHHWPDVCGVRGPGPSAPCP